MSLVAGTITVVAADTQSLSLQCAAATGGTGPYAYQWYRSTVNGFTPGAGNILAGKTSLAFVDSGLSAAGTFYYVCKVTDSASATANSPQAKGVAAHITAINHAHIFHAAGYAILDAH